LLKNSIVLTNIFENSVLDQLEFNNGNNYQDFLICFIKPTIA